MFHRPLAASPASPHESAARHVAGTAAYIDDMPEPDGLLHIALGLSSEAHAEIRGLDLEAVRKAEGVVAVFTAADIPGINDISATLKHDEPLLAEVLASYHGQPIFAVAATSRLAARRAVKLAEIDYVPLPALIDIAAARPGGVLVTAPMCLQRGEPLPVLAAAKLHVQGTMHIGGQEHFYLEGQIALALPGEADEIIVHSSTQHPSEVQAMVAAVLGVARHAVIVEVRRMGGAFGGKETQGNLFAGIAALVAKATGRAAKIRPDRDDDFIITGKRHDFQVDYTVAFTAQGHIEAVVMRLAARCGFSADLSGPVTDRALFHADNAYFYPHVTLTSQPLKTNTPSNTAFRGFGGPQGMLAAERLIEEIAFATGQDPLDVRKANLYTEGRDVTPYHQTIRDLNGLAILEALERTSDYRARRNAIRAFNAQSPVIRHGLALTPVKFGISFTATAYNQAGALVHIYTDGSVQVNHGGTEMGQGLHSKIVEVVARTLMLPHAAIKVSATNTGKVPNTSATAASSGADLNGKAAEAAALSLKARLIDFASQHYSLMPAQVRFTPEGIVVGAEVVAFAALVQAAYGARVQLSATGFYATPEIHWDRANGKGHPFYYFAWGAAVSEVAIDTLTGEYRVLRVDILHDVGQSLNEAIDRGQIEGGFIQGMGWLTTEELVFDDRGRLATHAPSTYKIPACSDTPPDFRVALAQGLPHSAETIYRSKAVGEPPLMLAISVLHALSDAVASLADYRICPHLDAPATPERVLAAVRQLKGRAW